MKKERLAKKTPAKEIRAEMAKLDHRILFEIGDYRAYLIPTSEAPLVMRELYRLREKTFRAVGEGSLRYSRSSRRPSKTAVSGSAGQRCPFSIRKAPLPSSSSTLPAVRLQLTVL